MPYKGAAAIPKRRWSRHGSSGSQPTADDCNCPGGTLCSATCDPLGQSRSASDHTPRAPPLGFSDPQTPSAGRAPLPRCWGTEHRNTVSNCRRVTSTLRLVAQVSCEFDGVDYSVYWGARSRGTFQERMSAFDRHCGRQGTLWPLMTSTARGQVVGNASGTRISEEAGSCEPHRSGSRTRRGRFDHKPQSCLGSPIHLLPAPPPPPLRLPAVTLVPRPSAPPDEASVIDQTQHDCTTPIYRAARRTCSPQACTLRRLASPKRAQWFWIQSAKGHRARRMCTHLEVNPTTPMTLVGVVQRLRRGRIAMREGLVPLK